MNTPKRRILSLVFTVLGTVHFFTRKGGVVGFGGRGGALNWLERGRQPKKNEGKGGGGVGRKN